MCVCSLSYRAGKAHALYCRLRPARLYNIFPYYLINGTIFENKLLNMKCVLRVSLQLLCEVFFILRRSECDINNIQGEHKVFPWLQTFITRKLHRIHIFLFQNVTQLKKFFLQHISTLQHVLLLLHGERLIDNHL